MLGPLVLSNKPRAGLITLILAVVAAWLGIDAWNSWQQRSQVARVLTQGDPSRALPLMRRYGCAGCHTIPGIAGADGQVGGPLADIRKRTYIGGVANNTADNLVHWIVSPQTFSPHSAMPVTGVSEAEARDIAAYLYVH
jgi:cytochrome c1